MSLKSKWRSCNQRLNHQRIEEWSLLILRPWTTLEMRQRNALMRRICGYTLRKVTSLLPGPLPHVTQLMPLPRRWAIGARAELILFSDLLHLLTTDIHSKNVWQFIVHGSVIIQMAIDEHSAYSGLLADSRVKFATWPTSWRPSGADRLSLRGPKVNSRVWLGAVDF